MHLSYSVQHQCGFLRHCIGSSPLSSKICGRGLMSAYYPVRTESQSLPVTALAPLYGCVFIVVVVYHGFIYAGFDMTSRNISTQIGHTAMTAVDPSDLMQSPPMSGFVHTSRRCVVTRCTPIQSTSGDVTRFSPSSGKWQVGRVSLKVVRKSVKLVLDIVNSKMRSAISW